MRFALILMLCAIPVMAQSTPAAAPPANVIFAGPSYCPGCSKQLGFTGGYGRAVSASVYAGVMVDIVPQTWKPFAVQYMPSAFSAQRWKQVGKLELWTLENTGISTTGSNTAWQWGAGGFAAYQASKNWRIIVGFRLLKSNTGSDYQGIATPAGMYLQ